MITLKTIPLHGELPFADAQVTGGVFRRLTSLLLFGVIHWSRRPRGISAFNVALVIVMSVKSSFYNEYDIKNNEKPVFWAQRGFQNHHQTFHDRCPEKIGPLPKKSDHWSTWTCPENIRPAPIWLEGKETTPEQSLNCCWLCMAEQGPLLSLVVLQCHIFARILVNESITFDESCRLVVSLARTIAIASDRCSDTGQAQGMS